MNQVLSEEDCRELQRTLPDPTSPIEIIRHVEAKVITAMLEKFTQGQEPVLFVSHEQFLCVNDAEGVAGKYLPVRKSSAGKFTFPLYTHPIPSQQEERVREDAAQLRYFAASLTYNDTTAEGEAKHRLHEIAMRIETGYYATRNKEQT